MIEAADLVASLRGEDQDFSRVMDVAGKSIENLHQHTDSAIKSVRDLSLGLGILAAGALAGAIKQAMTFQTMLVHIQSNTGLTDAQTRTMSDGIKRMAAETGAPLDQLAEGFMHIHNFGFDAADAMKLLKPAMESALSTGDNVGTVASTLGVVMHEFHIQTSAAAESMNVLHLAAQEGNATLGEFVDGTTRAFNVAGGFGVKLADLAAALSTLTQSGQTARSASDGMTAVMFGIVKPTQAAKSMIETLSHETGVNLVRDFSAAGLKARGLTPIIMDVSNAIHTMGGETDAQRKTLLDYADTLESQNVTGQKFVDKMTAMARSIGDPTQALIGLFPNVRAFREMLLLTGSQADSFTQHMRDMGAAMSGQIDPTQAGFIRQQASMEAQLAKLSANVQILAINLGTALLPSVTAITAAIVPVVQQFSDWASAHQSLVIGILAAATALGVLTAAVTVLGPAIAVATGPIGIIALAVVGLYEAWQHNIGGIQQVTQRVWTAVHPVFQAMETAVQGLQSAFKGGGVSGLFASLPSALGMVGAALAPLGGQITKQVQGWVSAFSGWIGPATQRLIAALPGIETRLLGWIQQTGADIGTAFLSYEKWVWSWWEPAALKLLSLIKSYGPKLFNEWLQYLGWLKNVTGQLATAAWHWIETVWPPLSAAAGNLLGKLLGWAGTATEPLRNQLLKWAAEFGAWVVPAVTQFLQKWPGMLSSLLDRVQAAAGPIADQLGKWASAFIDWVQRNNVIPKVVTVIGGIAAALWIFVEETAATLLVKLGQWGVAFVQWVAPRIGPLLGQVGNLLDRLVAWLHSTGVPALQQKLGEWSSAFGAWVMGTAWPYLQKEVPKLLNNLSAWIIGPARQAVQDHLGHWAGAFWGWVQLVWPKLVSEVVGLLKSLTDWIWNDARPKIQDQLGHWAGAFWGWVQSEAWPRLKTELGTLKKEILDHLKDAAQWLVKVGEDIVAGLIQGLKNKAGDLKNAVGDVAGAVTGGIKGLLHIKSPSLVMYQIGQDTGQGLVNGILDKVQAAGAAAMQLAHAAMTGAMSGTPNAPGASTASTPDTAAAGQNAYNKSIQAGIVLQQMQQDHEKRLAAIVKADALDNAKYLRDYAAENTRYHQAVLQYHAQEAAQRAADAAKAKADRAAAHAQHMVDMAADSLAGKKAAADEFAAYVNTLHGIDKARAEVTLHALQNAAQIAAINARDMNDAMQRARDLGAQQSRYAAQRLVDAREIADALKGQHAQQVNQTLADQLAQDRAELAAYTRASADLTGIDALKAKYKEDELGYLVQVEQAKIRYATDDKARANELGMLQGQWAAQALVDQNAIAAARKGIVATVATTATNAAAAWQAAFITGGAAIVAANQKVADQALKVWSAMVPKFSDVAAEAAKRIANVLATGGISGITPGNQAAASKGAFNQTDINANRPGVVSTPSQASQNFAALTGTQQAAQQQQAMLTQLGYTQTQQIQTVGQLRLYYANIHQALLDREKAAQTANNTALLAQLKQQDAQLTDNYKHELLHLQNLAVAQAQVTAQNKQQVALQAAMNGVTTAGNHLHYTQQQIDDARALAAIQYQYGVDHSDQQAQLATLVANYTAQHRSDLAAVAAAQAAHDTAAIAQAKQIEVAHTAAYTATKTQIQQEMAARTGAYSAQAQQIRAIITLLGQQHALTMAQIQQEAAARKLAGVIAGQSTPATPTGVTMADLTGGAASGNPLQDLLTKTIAYASTTFPDAMKANGKQFGILLTAGIAQGLGEYGAITYALAQLNQEMHTNFGQYWKIQSPSKVTHEMGRNIALGLANGIRAGARDVRAAFDTLSPSSGLRLGGLNGTTGVSSTAVTAPTTITVNVTGQGASVQGADHQGLGQAIGNLVQQFIQVQRTTAPGAPRSLPGAL